MEQNTELTGLEEIVETEYSVNVSQDEIKKALKENGFFAGIKNSDAYFRTRKGINKKMKKELDKITLDEFASQDNKKKAYLEIQKITDKYIRGIDAGRLELSIGLSTVFWSYYALGIAKNVADFSQVGLFKPIYDAPILGKAAAGLEAGLHAVADKVAFAFPQFDKFGHVGLGMIVGGVVEKVTDYATEKYQRWKAKKRKKTSDADDIAEAKVNAIYYHLPAQAGATSTIAVLKERLDDKIGGVNSMWDVAATIGGQLINAAMSVTKAAKYSTVIDTARKKLQEFGMDDDGNVLVRIKNMDQYEFYVPRKDSAKFNKAFKNGDNYRQYLKLRPIKTEI